MKHDIAPFKEDPVEDESTSTSEDSESGDEGSKQSDGTPDESKADSAKPTSMKDAEKSGLTEKKPPKCEVKEFESRHNLKGQEVLKELGQGKDADEADEATYAMKYYTYYRGDGTVKKVALEIHSEHIQEAIRSNIKSYPGQNFGGDTILLEGETKHEALACLYHYRTALEAFGKNSKTVSVKLDILLAVKFINKVFRRESKSYAAQMENNKSKSITFQDVWMVYKPGVLVYCGRDETECILEVLSLDFNPGGFDSPAQWTIHAKSFAHDGHKFGYVRRSIGINSYRGAQALFKLGICPLEYHPDEARLRNSQQLRGQKLRTLVGVQHRAYSGKARSVEYERVPTWYGGKDEYREEPITLSGRVIVDHLTYVKNRTKKGVQFHDLDEKIMDDSIGPEHYLLSHFEVPGFALLEKKWCWFRIDLLSDVEWDDGAFDLLIIPPGQKRVVRALTKQHTSHSDNFDDLVKGKGKGCIFLLHGAPGIGKTFTVESIADSIKRPLYVMMSGELGSDIVTVERNLKQVLELVTTWNAILLLDEADVFLEKRSSHDLARNGLVSIFLRTLEYFSGIMFLTTNRIDSFDLAFQSRIHLALKYQALDLRGRTALWKLFLRRTTGYREEDWPDEAIEEFAQAELNGRQIKNTIRTANTLALSEGQKMSAEEVRVVLDTVTAFDADFREQQRGEEASLPGRDETLGMGKLGLKGSEAQGQSKPRAKNCCGDC